MTGGAEQAAVETAAEHAGEGFNAGEMILHHILDGPEIEIPFSGGKYLPLPQIHVFGLDLSITRHVLMMWVACAILLWIGYRAARQAKDPVPRGIRNLLEVFVLYIRDEIARKAIGHDGDRFLGYLLTSFFFILTCNLIGLIPGFYTATSNIAVTLVLAALAFVMIQLGGIFKHGFFRHWGNLVPHGIPLWLMPVMIPVEILGMLAKPFALCIRLFANMTAGHIVIMALVSLIFILESVFVAAIAVPFTLFIYALEILVCFIQAYIFTMLVAQFIGMSVHPAH